MCSVVSEISMGEKNKPQTIKLILNNELFVKMLLHVYIHIQEPHCSAVDSCVPFSKADSLQTHNSSSTSVVSHTETQRCSCTLNLWHPVSITFLASTDSLIIATVLLLLYQDTKAA